MGLAQKVQVPAKVRWVKKVEKYCSSTPKVIINLFYDAVIPQQSDFIELATF